MRRYVARKSGTQAAPGKRLSNESAQQLKLFPAHPLQAGVDDSYPWSKNDSEPGASESFGIKVGQTGIDPDDHLDLSQNTNELLRDELASMNPEERKQAGLGHMDSYFASQEGAYARSYPSTTSGRVEEEDGERFVPPAAPFGGSTGFTAPPKNIRHDGGARYDSPMSKRDRPGQAENLGTRAWNEPRVSSYPDSFDQPLPEWPNHGSKIPGTGASNDLRPGAYPPLPKWSTLDTGTSTSTPISDSKRKARGEFQSLDTPEFTEHKSEGLLRRLANDIPAHDPPLPSGRNAQGFLSLGACRADIPVREDIAWATEWHRGSGATKLETNDLDYEANTLYEMSFAKLREEPFDLDPHMEPPEFQSNDASASLASRLDSVANRSAEEQQRFFATLTLEEWEEAGDWFNETFKGLTERLRRNRKVRRDMAREFEEEIAVRHRAVTQEMQGLDATLKKMKEKGASILSTEKKEYQE